MQTRRQLKGQKTMDAEDYAARLRGSALLAKSGSNKAGGVGWGVDTRERRLSMARSSSRRMSRWGSTCLLFEINVIICCSCACCKPLLLGILFTVMHAGGVAPQILQSISRQHQYSCACNHSGLPIHCNSHGRGQHRYSCACNHSGLPIHCNSHRRGSLAGDVKRRASRPGDASTDEEWTPRVNSVSARKKEGKTAVSQPPPLPKLPEQQAAAASPTTTLPPLTRNKQQQQEHQGQQQRQAEARRARSLMLKAGTLKGEVSGQAAAVLEEHKREGGRWMIVFILSEWVKHLFVCLI